MTAVRKKWSSPCLALIAITTLVEPFLAYAQSDIASNGVPSALLQAPAETGFYSPYSFIVDKKARTLEVWQNSEAGLHLVKSYQADLGKIDGPKQERDDHRTPEGVYFLQKKLEAGSIDFKLYGKRAFTTNYPNLFDVRDGKTGSGIWLHSVPDDVPLTRGSRGCVVVRNDAILALTDFVTLGRTPIIIHEEVERVSPTDLKLRQNLVTKFIENWRTAWESRNIESYIANYGDDFKALGMDRSAWKEYKSRLNSTYKTMSVRLSKPVIYSYKDRVVARFLQEYSSDQHSDFGEKLLYLKVTGNSPQIVGEEWLEESSPIAREEMKGLSTAQTPNTASNSANRN